MQSHWELTIALESGARTPLFLQISRAIADDIRRTRLRPGQRLPGSRTLARSLGVSRNTTVTAYAELIAQGWVTPDRARGMFVAVSSPDAVTAPALSRRPIESAPDRVGYAVPPRARAADAEPRSQPRARFQLSGALPDVRLVPVGVLARAYRRALGHAELLSYATDARGDLRLRERVAEMVSALRGVAARPDTVLITRGSQMGLHLAARVLAPTGERIAVEALGYPRIWDALAAAGAHLVPVPVDEAGLRVDRLAALVQKQPIRAVYLTPHHQFPTTVVLSARRRLELLELARRHRFAILEDDVDHDFHYEGRPVLPLASLDEAGVVIYVSTLSKVLAPGLRLGFVVAPRPVVDLLARTREAVDRHGDQVLERAVAELIEDGELQRHARRMRRIYLARRDALLRALASDLGSVLRVRTAPGGLALWARAAAGVDVERWAQRARARGVVIQTARQFAFDGRARPYLRLGFSRHSERELQEAARLLRAARP